MSTMLQNHTREVGEIIKIMERSILSARYCFMETHLQLNNIDPIKFEIVKQWYEFVMEKIQFDIDSVIYLRSTPEVLLHRINERGRQEEQGIQLDFLKLLHDKHDDWLIQSKFPKPSKVIVFNGNNDIFEMLTEIESELLEAGEIDRNFIKSQ